MTLLVGMIGTDGIVFAADELLVGEAQHGTRYDDRVFIQKIQHLQAHRVVFAGVGDDTTRRVEDRLLSVLDEGFDFTNVKRSLERITKDALKAVREKAELDYPDAEDRRAVLNEHLPRAILIVFYGDQLPERQLWSVFISDPPAVFQITGYRVSGGLGNIGRFFADYYQSGTPVSSLKRMAAYTVLAGKRFDSAMIGGLQLAVIDGGGLHYADETERTALREEYRRLNDVVRDHLLAP
jgi:hypothetical protein